jgi:tripartite-type tricarboxylate transporter receptor subunit TctC
VLGHPRLADVQTLGSIIQGAKLGNSDEGFNLPDTGATGKSGSADLSVCDGHQQSRSVIEGHDSVLDLNVFGANTASLRGDFFMDDIAIRRRALFGAAAALTCAPLRALAAPQAHSTKPITLIVPSVAGGGTDAIARSLGLELGKRLGQTIVVENVAGASGSIGAAKVAPSQPDGHTLLVANSDLALVTLVHKNPGYALTDLAPIAKLGSSPLSLVARRGFPATDLDQLIKMAKAQPGKISVALSGAAALPALGVAMLEQAAQIDFLKIPYKGAAQAMTDVFGGQVDLCVTAALNSIGPERAGQVKILGLMSEDRLAAAPEVPRIPENPATRTVSLDIWIGLFGPAGMPAPLVQQINEAVQAVLRDPAYKAVRAKAGEQTAQPASAEEFAKYLNAETARYRVAAKRLPTE